MGFDHVNSTSSSRPDRWGTVANNPRSRLAITSYAARKATRFKGISCVKLDNDPLGSQNYQKISVRYLALGIRTRCA